MHSCRLAWNPKEELKETQQLGVLNPPPSQLHRDVLGRGHWNASGSLGPWSGSFWFGKDAKHTHTHTHTHTQKR